MICQVLQNYHHQVHQTEVTNQGQVTNSKILKSIQSITEVMQQQLLLNSKTTEQGIVQTASLFQEMIKAQEKRDLDLHFSWYPRFREKLVTDHNVWTGCQESKTCVTNQDAHFVRKLLISQAFWYKNFIQSLNERITNNELTEKILQFFSDMPMTSHALNKLRLI